jgi:Cys-rich repeat protein
VKCTGDGQCTNPERPKCNVATGSCVECLDSTQCASKASTPICDTGRGGRCVECVTNAHCGDGGTPFCKDSECVQCRNDNDCAGGVTDKCEKGACVPK